MIVMFSTRFGRLTMFGEPAVTLLRMAGHSGAIPGAILAADLPSALRTLRAALETSGHVPSPAPSEGDAVPEGQDRDRVHEKPVSLYTRAVPLMDMIDRAISGTSDLMWDRG